MSTPILLSRAETAALRELERQLGKREARNALATLGLRAWLACQRVGLASVEIDIKQEPASSLGDPEEVEILRAALRTRGLEVSRHRGGRPSTVLLTARRHEVVIGELGHEVRVSPGAPALCALSTSSRRTAAGAIFNIGRVADRETRATGVSPDVYAFILVDERRVWVATRPALVMFRKALEKGDRVRMFGLGPRGSLRLRFPSKPTGLDIEQQVFPSEAP